MTSTGQISAARWIQSRKKSVSTPGMTRQWVSIEKTSGQTSTQAQQWIQPSSIRIDGFIMLQVSAIGFWIRLRSAAVPLSGKLDQTLVPVEEEEDLEECPNRLKKMSLGGLFDVF